MRALLIGDVVGPPAVACLVDRVPRLATTLDIVAGRAYVRPRRARVENPQILSAFDSVGRWIAEHRRVETGPPREVYFARFASAGRADEVCDVAFPIR